MWWVGRYRERSCWATSRCGHQRKVRLHLLRVLTNTSLFLFDDRCPGRCEVIAGCGFDSRLPDGS